MGKLAPMRKRIALLGVFSLFVLIAPRLCGDSLKVEAEVEAPLLPPPTVRRHALAPLAPRAPRSRRTRTRVPPSRRAHGRRPTRAPARRAD